MSSVLVACLRCELRPSVVRLLASTWCGILWFIWCHRLRCLSYRSIQLPFAAYCPLDSLGGATASLCILPTSPLSCPQGRRLQLPTGQPVLGRHRLVSILVETSGCCCRGSIRLICQLVSRLRRGEHPAERAGLGVWVGTPSPVDLSSPRWAPPPTASAVCRVSSLSEGSHIAPHAEEKSLRDFPPGPVIIKEQY